MRILTCQLENFASYQKLDFDFTNQGLTLIHGPTGSGKSTLCDAAPWVLFGKTAKNGAVDEVLSWPGNLVTKGTVALDNGITVFRSRGPKSKDNDLHFSVDGAPPTRGKDVTDTQRLLNQHLGIDCDLYLSGAYFHEFSATAAFFTTTPKNRRAACEQIVDLNLAKTLQTELAITKKDTKNALIKIRTEMEGSKAKYEYAKKLKAEYETKLLSWEDKQVIKIQECQVLHDNFDEIQTTAIEKLKVEEAQYEEDAAQRRHQATEIIASLEERELVPIGTDTVCPTCRRSGFIQKNETGTGDQLRLAKKTLATLQATQNPYTKQIAVEAKRTNVYAQMLTTLKNEDNPHTASLLDLIPQLEQYQTSYAELSTKEFEAAQALGDIDLLSDLVTTFRASLVQNTIKSLEENTNALLSQHFDAEIQVSFDITDDVDVSITKDGNACVYTQLSKGQRQLLKLCFGVAVMKQVSNHQGIRFHQVFFDEALDGLGETMKVKAFGLLKTLELEYESVFVVDHSLEIKPLFFNHYAVELIDSVSTIQEGL